MTQKPDPHHADTGSSDKPSTTAPAQTQVAAEAPIKLEGPIDANTPGLPEYLHDDKQPFVPRSITLAERNEMERRILPGESKDPVDLTLDPADSERGEYEVGEPPPAVVSKLLQAPPPYKPSTAAGMATNPGSGSHPATADPAARKPATAAGVSSGTYPAVRPATSAGVRPPTASGLRPEDQVAAQPAVNEPYVPLPRFDAGQYPAVLPAEFAGDQTPSGPNEHGLAFLIALNLLTRIPLVQGVEEDPETRSFNVRRSLIYFPLIGSMIGVFTAAIICVGTLIWPVWLAVLVGLAIEPMMTRAMHESALGRVFGAFSRPGEPAQILDYMALGQTGPAGAIAVVLQFAVRAGAIFVIATPDGSLQLEHLFAAIVASTTLGHWIMLAVMAALTPLRQVPPSPQDIAGTTTGAQMLMATLLAIPGLIGMVLYMPIQLVIAVIALLIVVSWFNQLVFKRIGGATSDCLGAICSLSQAVVLLVAAGTFRHG